jgi:hypothetical protein
MVYTCFEMIRDCRANRPEGWWYFVSNYVPVIRKIVRHYGPEWAIAEGEVLVAIHDPQSSLFASLEGAPERPFVAELRQRVLGVLDGLAPLPEPEMGIDPETLTAALEPLTLLEKQAVWLETMGYSPGEAAAMLHSTPATIEKIRAKAGERLRANADRWRASILTENGRRLGLAAAAAGTEQCLPAKAFLELLDGRTTWRGREELERHVNGCWHCIDRFCRLMETIELLRGVQPLTETEAQPFSKLLGIVSAKPPLWQRLFGARTGA